MSLIEKAVERLGQLKQAGQEAPVITPLVEAVAGPAPVPTERSRVEIHAKEAEPVSRAVNIDLERLAHMGFVTPDQQRASIAEEYRVIKRPLLRNASAVRGTSRVANGNLIMVTSALPGEGKSFTALNLAMSMAMELDHSVLLVDADVSKPSILKQLGLPPERGLMDVLVDAKLDLPDVILRTNIEKLRILPAGTATQRATELLASEGMNRLLDEMASRYADRIIVFDSPPLLVTTESRALATHMGQIVVVVEAERTTHAALKQALATIEACPIKMMLLNKSTVQGPGGYYGYGYGYGQESEDDKAA
ncbi:XrtA-associated tyrosine autokinase [Denitromonas sp.]|uniref:XrtA-associated tyrosine autokinase n=1 Tax=Denitromonas sp. TaxID=2734609 RepID=UPI003A836E85